MIKPILNKNKTYLVYVRSKNFLARGIQFFMRLYALRFKGRPWRKPVNHADIVHHGLVWGSVAQGFYPRTIEHSWNKATKLYVYELEPKVSPKEIDKVLQNYLGRPYDAKNFIDFIVKLAIGRWTGHTKHHAEKKLYCIEAVHKVMEDIGIEPVLENAWDNDPEESRLWAEKNLKLVDI